MMRINEAYNLAISYDRNRDRVLENRELRFSGVARELTDSNRDGYVTVDECAFSLMRGDVYVASNNKVYPNAGRYAQYQPTYPGYGYQQPYFPTNSNISPIGGMLTGAAVGGAIGALLKGIVGLQTGAIIGAAAGLISGVIA